MDVYGVDPSLTCTGLAKTTPAGVILTKRVPTVATGSSLGAVRKRVRYIVGQVLQFAPEGEFLTVIESPYVPPKMRAGAVIERAWLFGMLVDQLILRGAVVQVAPATRAMYATGSGNARKPEVVAAMRAKFPEVPIQDDNVADALALMCMGARWIGEPVDGELSKKQLQAMVAVHWPQVREEEKSA
jgi:Holliday junction resolvasome RuvABC endonuclease subunit